MVWSRRGLQGVRVVSLLKGAAVIALLAGGSIAARAQGEGVLSQSWTMPWRYVPAAAGSGTQLRAVLAGRLQWAGVEGAPRTVLVCGDMPTPVAGGALGAGLSVEIEKIGLFSNMSFSAQGAWHFKIGKGNLSAGVSLGYFSQKFKGEEAVLPEGGGDDGEEPEDPNARPVAARDLGGGALDVGLGVQYATKHFYIGLGAAHITQPRVRLSIGQGNEGDFETELSRTLYLSVGGNIRAGSTLIEIQPSVLARTDFHGFSGVGVVRCVYRNLLSVGAGCRWREAITLQAGVQLRSVYIGYAYDLGTSGIAGRTRGSHEVVATYTTRMDFTSRKAHKQKSIRFM